MVLLHVIFCDAPKHNHMEGQVTPMPLLVGICTDRGSNVLAGVREIGGSYFCLCHLLKSAVDGLLDPAGVFYCEELRSITDVSLATAQFRGNAQNLRALQVSAPPDVAHLTVLNKNLTRWEGLAANCKRTLQLKDGLQKLFEAPEATQAFLQQANICLEDTSFPDNTYFDDLQFVYNLLVPLQVLSKRAQSATEPVMMFARMWISEALAAFEPVDTDLGCHAIIRNAFKTAITHFLGDLITLPSMVTKAALLNPVDRDATVNLSQSDISCMWDELIQDAFELGRLGKNGNQDDNEVSIAEFELVKYSAKVVALDLAKERQKEHAGDLPSIIKGFWLVKDHVRPIFLPAVRQFMAMPLASSSPEQIFSFTGNLVSDKRTSFTTANVEALTVIKSFMSQPQFSLKSLSELLDSKAKEAAERKRLRMEEQRTQLQDEIAQRQKKLQTLTHDDSGSGAEDNF